LETEDPDSQQQLWANANLLEKPAFQLAALFDATVDDELIHSDKTTAGDNFGSQLQRRNRYWRRAFDQPFLH
jgi:hypothetical protein